MAADTRPRPGPGQSDEPATPVERRGSALPAVSPEPGERRRTSASGSRLHRMRRSLRRTFRGPRRKWALAAVVAAVAVVLGLLGSGFLSSPAPPVDSSAPGDASGGGTGVGVAPTTGASSERTNATDAAASGPATGGDIKDLLENKFDNPLNNLRSPGYHSVTVTARSSAQMSIVGYLVPTGSDAYGSRRKTASFTLTQRAYGPGYLAAVFIQAGQSGAPVTCSVTVDGKTTNTEATSGPYGRAVCVG